MGAEANGSCGVHAVRREDKKTGDLPCLPLDDAKARQPSEGRRPARIQIANRRKKFFPRKASQSNTWQRHQKLRDALEAIPAPESVNAESLRQRVTPSQHATCLPVLIARQSSSNTTEERYPSGSSSSSSSNRVRPMTYHVLPPSNTPSPGEAGSQPFPVSAPELSRGGGDATLRRVSSEQSGYKESIFYFDGPASGARTNIPTNTIDGGATRRRHQQRREEQEVMPPRGVDGLLARPSPSLDDMLSPSKTSAVLESGIGRHRAYLHHRHNEEGLLFHAATSKSLPDLSRCRKGGGGSNGSSSTTSISSTWSSREEGQKVAEKEMVSGGAHREGHSHQGTSNNQGCNKYCTKDSVSCSSGVRVSAAKKDANKSHSCSYHNNNNNIWDVIKRKLAARSPSGGVPQPFPIQYSNWSLKGRSGHRAAAAVHSRTLVSSPSLPRTSIKLDGLDTTLLREAFAFAEMVAREEREELGDERCRRSSRGLTGRSSGAGSSLLSPVEHGEAGSVGRWRTKSACSSAVVSESEDWVRGLPVSFERGSTLPSRQTIRRQEHQQRWRENERHRERFRAAAVATSTKKRRVRRTPPHQTTQSSSSQSGSNGNGPPTNGNASDQGGRKEQGGARARQEKPLRVKRAHDLRPSGLDQAGGEGGADGNRIELTTAEMVDRFESGTGVAELRAELAASQASMSRSAHVIRQAAARWRGR